MSLRLCLVSTLALLTPACATDQPSGGPDAGGDPIARGLDRCADDGIALGELWTVDNLHGAMLALTIAPDGTAVVTTSDGAVKQWSLGADADSAPLAGGRPSYGDPFTDAGTMVAALAIGADGGEVLGGDAAGALHRWAIADAGDLGSRGLAETAMTAVVGVDAGHAVVADDSFGGAMRVVPLDGGDPGAPFETGLWGVTSLAVRDGALYTAGHDYGMAAVERRDAAAPAQPADAWDDLSTEGWVRAIDVSADGAWVAAAGDGFVAVLDAADLAAGPVARLDATASSIAFTSSGGHLAVITADGAISLWDRTLSAQVATIAAPSPVALAVDPSGDRLVVASTDGQLRAYACR